MSQMSSGTSAFAAPPANPYSQRVREQLNAAQPQPVPQQPAPQQAAEGTQLVPPPPARREAISPYLSGAQPQAQPTVQQSVPQQQPVQPQPMPTYQPPVPPAYPQVDVQRLMSEAQQLRAERDALREQVAQGQQELSEYNLLKEQADIQNSISKDAFANLQSVDADDAELISRVTANATAKVAAQLRQEMADQRKAMEAESQRQADNLRTARIQRLNQEVLAAHPDFYELQNRPDYQQFMNQRDGLSFKTRDRRAAEEFLAGNSAYVVNMLNEYKQGRATPQQVTAVAPAQFASGVPNPAPSQAQSPKYTLHELNSLYQMRRIPHETYRAELDKLRAANSF